MKLRELLADIEVAEIAGDADAEIAGLAYDSRRVEPGTLFFCVPGQRSDGHEFGELAVEGGAAALVVERLLGLPVTQVRVADARAAMASARSRRPVPASSAATSSTSDTAPGPSSRMRAGSTAPKSRKC